MRDGGQGISDGAQRISDGGQGVSDGGQGMISGSHFSPLVLLATCPALVSSPALQPGNSPGANLWGLAFIYNPPKTLPSFRGPELTAAPCVPLSGGLAMSQRILGLLALLPDGAGGAPMVKSNLHPFPIFTPFPSPSLSHLHPFPIFTQPHQPARCHEGRDTHSHAGVSPSAATGHKPLPCGSVRGVSQGRAEISLIRSISAAFSPSKS